MTQIEEFSDSYFIVDAELMPYTGKSVAVAEDVHQQMCSHVELPLLKIDNEHYLATPQWGVPPDVIAVPNSVDTYEETALMAKRGTAKGIVERGEFAEKASGESGDE